MQSLGIFKILPSKSCQREVNWDNQLLEKLPKIDKAQTKEEFSLVLENWIDDLGPVKEIAPIAAPKDVEFFDKNFDLSWFNNKLFSKKLSKKLKFIEDNRFQTTEEFGPGFDAMKSAKNYFDLDYTNKGPRILMLFAYWNLIEYYFPYKYVMDQKWDLSLVQALPSVVDAKSDVDFYIAIKKLIVKINDSHTETPIYGISSLRRFNYFPATGKIIDEKLVVTEILGDSLAEASNIKIGDVITKINGKTIKELISENRDLICASNEPKFLDKVVSPIFKKQF